MPQMMPTYWVLVFFVSLLVFWLFMSGILMNVFPTQKGFIKSFYKISSWLK